MTIHFNPHIDRVLAEPAPGIDCICVDRDPEMTALLAEPAPERTMAEIVRDMIAAETEGE